MIGDSQPLGSGSSAEELESIVLGLEALAAERDAITAEMRERRRDAADKGYDIPTINLLLARRKKSPEEVLEGDRLLETYEAALGSGAAAVGVLSAKRGADGTFQVKMAPVPDAGEKLTKAVKSRNMAVMMAELAKRARAEDL